MSEVKHHIPFDEFSENLARIFERVISEGEAIVVENEAGEGVVIRPLPPPTTKRAMTEEAYHAFRSAFGGWADVDTESLKQAMYESRQSSRPPVTL